MHAVVQPVKRAMNDPPFFSPPHKWPSTLGLGPTNIDLIDHAGNTKRLTFWEKHLAATIIDKAHQFCARRSFFFCNYSVPPCLIAALVLEDPRFICHEVVVSPQK